MTYNGHGHCFPVDYVNIRGHAASVTTAQFWQAQDQYPVHIDSGSTRGACKLYAGAASSEDNFGYYGTFNKKFRCTMGDDQTTQWWFGGYMAD